jgi:hypothetical protein
MWALRAMVMLMPAEKAPDSSTRALWQSYQQRLVEGRRNGRRSSNFVYQHLRCVNGSLTRRKNLRQASGFTFHPKEGVLRTFIALRNQSSSGLLKPRPLGPVTSTLTTTPPRGLWRSSLVCLFQSSDWTFLAHSLGDSYIPTQRIVVCFHSHRL